MSFDENENGPLMSFVAANAAQNDLFVAIFPLSDLFLGCRVLQLHSDECRGEKEQQQHIHTYLGSRQVRRELRFIY